MPSQTNGRRSRALQWERLAELSPTIRRRPHRLDRAERAEFIDLYQRSSAHLSQIRTGDTNPRLEADLTRRIAAANAAIYKQSPHPLGAVRTFFSVTFPAAVYHIRRQILLAGLVFFVPLIVMTIWVGSTEQVRDELIPPALAEAYLAEDFEAYYSSEAAGEFTTAVFVNNVWVSMLAFSVGVVLCIPTSAILIYNGINIGVAAGVFLSADQFGKFLGLILPHGFMELTAITIAGGAGFALGWAVIDCGDMTRSQSLAECGRRMVPVVGGLVLAFLAAALIEGFVTGSSLSTWARVGIGALCWLAFVLYIAGFGRAAAAAGFTGALGENRPKWTDRPEARLDSTATIALR